MSGSVSPRRLYLRAALGGPEEGLRQAADPEMCNACRVLRKLADEFATAARLYYEAVVALTCKCSAISSNDFDELHLAKEQARRRSEAARLAFNEHIRSHRCISADYSCEGDQDPRTVSAS